MTTPPRILYDILAILLIGSPVLSRGNVSFSEGKDSIRVEIDGELFTEWQYSAWSVPYLYPVIGPNGVNITRHFPMKKGVPGEQEDHPHHRSIRFSHRKVNGMSFWSPDSEIGKHETRIELREVEQMEGGETGTLILKNHWIGDDKVMLVERATLRFIPLENRQLLMDYDVSLMAPEVDVTFEDEKDGGLSIRVAGSIKVADHKTKEGNGTILNSRGDRNDEAWGKRAEWCDFFGPDSTGKVVGIAIFDHPDNLRHPTHWHARTYGLLTANRFGTGFFEAKSGAEIGQGDYTIKAGESLTLRHRFYFHHDDPETAGVAEKYAKYTDSNSQ